MSEMQKLAFLDDQVGTVMTFVESAGLGFVTGLLGIHLFFTYRKYKNQDFPSMSTEKRFMYLLFSNLNRSHIPYQRMFGSNKDR